MEVAIVAVGDLRHQRGVGIGAHCDCVDGHVGGDILLGHVPQRVAVLATVGEQHDVGQAAVRLDFAVTLLHRTADAGPAVGREGIQVVGEGGEVGLDGDVGERLEDAVGLVELDLGDGVADLAHKDEIASGVLGCLQFVVITHTAGAVEHQRHRFGIGGRALVLHGVGLGFCEGAAHKLDGEVVGTVSSLRRGADHQVILVADGPVVDNGPAINADLLGANEHLQLGERIHAGDVGAGTIAVADAQPHQELARPGKVASVSRLRRGRIFQREGPRIVGQRQPVGLGTLRDRGAAHFHRPPADGGILYDDLFLVVEIVVAACGVVGLIARGRVEHPGQPCSDASGLNQAQIQVVDQLRGRQDRARRVVPGQADLQRRVAGFHFEEVAIHVTGVGKLAIGEAVLHDRVHRGLGVHAAVAGLEIGT